MDVRVRAIPQLTVAVVAPETHCFLRLSPRARLSHSTHPLPVWHWRLASRTPTASTHLSLNNAKRGGGGARVVLRVTNCQELEQAPTGCLSLAAGTLSFPGFTSLFVQASEQIMRCCDDVSSTRGFMGQGNSTHTHTPGPLTTTTTAPTTTKERSFVVCRWRGGGGGTL